MIVIDGERLRTFRSARSAMFTIEWVLKTQTLVTLAYQRTDLRAQKRQPNGGRSTCRARRARPQEAGPDDVTRGRGSGAAAPQPAIAPQDEGQALLIAGPALIFWQLQFLLDRLPASALARGRPDLGRRILQESQEALPPGPV